MLTHILVEPRRAPVTKPYHCLVLHGLGDSKEGWMDAVPLLALDELSYIFVDAPDAYYGGFSWFTLAPDAQRNLTADATGVRRSRAALEALIAHLVAREGVTHERLFILGFSQGCLMAYDVALRAASPFAGVIGISGFFTLLDECPAAFGAAVQRQPYLLTHGRHDRMIPIAAVRQQKDQLIKLGVAIEWREYDKEHTLDQRSEAGDIRAWIHQRMT